MFEFVPRQVPNQIFVIGCGGTGSRLVPLLAQFMRTVTHGVTPRGNVMNPTIFLVDDDVVEHKNLLRQNFIESDVGKPKAAVLASRYSRAYGVNIVPIVARVTRDRDFLGAAEEAVSNAGGNAMIILCVDSAQARRDILAHWTDYLGASTGLRSQQPFVIDAGNEDNFGQVRFFNLVVPQVVSGGGSKELLESIPKLTPEKVQLDFLPMDVRFYEELQDNAGGSCADLDQTLAINALMATMIMGVVQNFYYVKPFTYHSMGISLNGSVSTSLLTPQYLYDISVNRGTGERGPRGRAVRVDTHNLLHTYKDVNTRKLAEMGLKPDGTPIAQPKPVTSVPVMAAPEEVADEESLVMPADAASAAAPEMVATSGRRTGTGRRAAAAPAIMPLPAGVTTPPPLTPRR